MSTYYVAGIPYSDELYHYGIKGQKWGVRRYQNEDGTYTPAGKERYQRELNKMAAKDAQRVSDARAAYGEGAGVRRKLLDKEIKQKQKDPEYAKAYDEASKHVNVAKSLKRAEKLHKHSGTFVRGRDLADRGYKHSQNVLKAAGTIGMTALTVGGAYYSAKSLGHSRVAPILFAAGGASIVGTVAKSVSDVHAYNYYERNKKF